MTDVGHHDEYIWNVKLGQVGIEFAIILLARLLPDAKDVMIF